MHCSLGAWETSREVLIVNVRTDLAIEAKRMWDRSMQEKTKLPGVKARQSGHFGIPIDVVEVLDKTGAERLGKPVGTYVTVELSCFFAKEKNYFRNAAEAIARVLRTMLPPHRSVLVVGLGNRDITPDAVGPLTLASVIVTRHLVRSKRREFDRLMTVSAFEPGVLGTTGIESLDLVKAALSTSGAECVIVVDALASCEAERICTTVQITDTGIVPGSGVGNRRCAFTREELGVPVYAVGVPTVMDADTLRTSRKSQQDRAVRDLIVTPRSIDTRVREIGKLLGYGIDLALQPELSFDDIPVFLS